MRELSIIIPAYNSEKTISKCLDSLLSQTIKDYEIIVVNDGSTDTTGKIIDSYSQKYDNIISIHRENGGQANARNSGLEIAHGKYITFVDSDDLIEVPDMYEHYLTILEQHPDIDLLQFPTKWKNIKGEKITDNIDIDIVGYENIKASFLNDELRGMPCNKIFKRDLLENTKFIPGRYFEDTWLIMDLLPYLKKITFTSYGYYTYVIRQGSEMKSQFNVSKYKNEIESYLRRYFLFANEQKKSVIFLNYYLAFISVLCKATLIHGIKNFESFLPQINNINPKLKDFEVTNENKFKLLKLLIIKTLGLKNYIKLYCLLKKK